MIELWKEKNNDQSVFENHKITAPSPDCLDFKMLLIASSWLGYMQLQP